VLIRNHSDAFCVADPGAGAFLSLGSGPGMNFFRIPDLGSRGYVFGEIFLRILFLLIKLVPETIRSKKKVGFIFHPSFYAQ
jgi:hypothetical protein